MAVTVTAKDACIFLFVCWHFMVIGDPLVPVYCVPLYVIATWLMPDIWLAVTVMFTFEPDLAVDLYEHDDIVIGCSAIVTGRVVEYVLPSADVSVTPMLYDAFTPLVRGAVNEAEPPLDMFAFALLKVSAILLIVDTESAPVILTVKADPSCTDDGYDDDAIDGYTGLTVIAAVVEF